MTKKRILVLDDDELVGETVANYINMLGEEQRHTASLSEFYESFDQWFPDIVVIDLQLQGSDGISTFRELELRETKASIIIMSGADQKILESARDAARERGLHVIGILNKPFVFNDLKELLQSPAPGAVVPRAEMTNTFSFQDLQQGIANKDIFVVVQPKFSSKTSTLTGFEALARWKHVRLGDIPPEDFIAKAESWGLIDDLTKVVFEQSAVWFTELIRSLKVARDYYHLADNLSLAVNLSAKSLANDLLFDWIYSRCDEYGLTSDKVVFELTESSALRDIATSLDNLTRIRLRGFNLSIDDFGSGYSSLLQLVRLPFSEMKIDKSFVISSEHSQDSRSVIRAAVSLAASMGMRVTAEGVETATVFDLMTRLGCDLIQGYFTGRPMSPESVEQWFHERESKRRQKQVETAICVNQINFRENNKILKVAQLTAAILEVPTVLITSLEESTQKTLIKVKFERADISRDTSFCTIAIMSDEMFVIEDASSHEIFSDNELVTCESGIRFYAGKPYFVQEGGNIGTLSAIDYRPRQISETQRKALTTLADILGREVSRETLNVHKPKARFADKNIRQFRDQAFVLWEFCSRMSLEMEIFIIRLTGLDCINCSHGREVGDRLVSEINDVLSANSRSADVGGRFRGACFVLMTIKTDKESLNLTANSLLSSLEHWRSNHPDGLHDLTIGLTSFVCAAKLENSFESILEDAIDYM